MIKLGLDFDNTLITYDSFLKKHSKKNMQRLSENKNLIRNYLGKDKEILFTLLQGEVYGKRISEASQADGMYAALKKQKIKEYNYLLSVINKTPYKGPKYDLPCSFNMVRKKPIF